MAAATAENQRLRLTSALVQQGVTRGGVACIVAEPLDYHSGLWLALAQRLSFNDAWR